MGAILNLDKEHQEMMDEAKRMVADARKMAEQAKKLAHEYVTGEMFQKQHNKDLYIFNFSRLTWRRRLAIFWKLTTTALGVLVFGDGQLKLRRK